MTRSFWGRIAGAAVAVAMAFTLAPTASAAPSRPTGDDDTGTNPNRPLVVEELAASAKVQAGWDPIDLCEGRDGLIDVWAGPHYGQLHCKPGRYIILRFVWPNGRWEVFGVGSDYAIYHSWQDLPGDTDWNAWARQPGYATAGVYWHGLYNGEPWLIVRGNDNRDHCSHFVPNPNSWTPWDFRAC